MPLAVPSARAALHALLSNCFMFQAEENSLLGLSKGEGKPAWKIKM